MLLATFTTTTFWDGPDVDPGDGVSEGFGGGSTLRSGVMEANALPGWDTIRLEEGTYALTLPGQREDAAATGDLDVTENLTIIGAGADRTIIDVSRLDRVFEVSGAAVLRLQGVTITRGWARGPNEGNNNNGGGILVGSSDAALLLENTIVADNVANANGGGIYSEGILTIVDSTLSDNRVAVDGGGVHSSGESMITGSLISRNMALLDGGGIKTFNEMTITGSRLESNEAQRNGGGILNYDALAIAGSVLDDNEAGEYGGGICNWGWGGGELTIQDSILSNNRASDGGAIYIHHDHVATITRSTVSGNSADQGGGIYSDERLEITDSTVRENSATVSGGGIYCQGSLDVTDSTVSDNSAGHGGGIYSDERLEITDSTVSGNEAGWAGGGIFNKGNSEIIRSTISVNSASLLAGGGIVNNGQLSITGSTLSGNSSNNGGGIVNSGQLSITGSSLSNNSSNNGGAIVTGGGSTLTIGRSTLSGNSAANDGGGIYCGGHLTITTSTLSDNSAENVGGGIYNQGGDVLLTNSTIFDNFARTDGGGVYNSRDGTVVPVSVRNTIIGGNRNLPSFGPVLDVFGSFNSLGNNLIGDRGISTGFTDGVSDDLVGTSSNPVVPMLGPLQNNGGPTLTHAPLLDALFRSPAVDAGNNATTTATDQRGMPRIVDGDNNGAAVVDIGAVERGFKFNGLRSTPGLYDPAQAAFHLKNVNANPPAGADIVFRYGPRDSRGWIPLVGDFDGDGVDTIGLYDPESAGFHLKNTNANSPAGADISFRFGPRGSAGWQPIVGDFDGDGIDTVGLYDPSGGGFHLKNSNTTGGADVTFTYGPRGNRGWTALVGDWNNDGIDTVGLYAPANAGFHLKNINAAGPADVAPFRFGPASAGWRPLVGDWNNDGHDTVGLYEPGAARFHLKNNNANPPRGANIVFRYGPAHLAWTPLVGDWNGSDFPILRAAGGEAASSNAAALTEAELQPIIAEAIAGWDAAGIDADFSGVEFVITNLPGAMLGLAEADTIYIDADAAGYGWFVDPTPGSDEEFCPARPGGELVAVDPDAVDQMDLLTVVSHELGHLLGLEDLDPSAGSLMSGTLETGLRRGPGAAEIDALFGGL